MIKLGKYQHFKGNFYQVLYIAKHSENEELMVVYLPLHDEEHNEKFSDDTASKQSVWVRPLAMFDETIEREGKQQKRFCYVGP
ncbi:MAG: hypothetical protein ACI93V_000802 [Alteromonadaceae bacterium]|jgi:hypothetical protein|tara:strand:- start:3182 stop:3430 length:249 start_codon:yes stop_codon:yes gene_type:complete